MTPEAKAFTVRSTDGVRIVVHDLGGRGRPALLVHANGFHGRVFRALAGELAGELHCFALDLRGHGCSGIPEDLDFAWGGHAQDALAALAGIESRHGSRPRALGIGHSLGASALLRAEAARPGSFAGIYAYEPILVPPSRRPAPTVESQLARAARSRRDEFGSFEEALAHYRRRPLFGEVAPEVLEDYVRHALVDDGEGRLRLACRPEHEARTFEAASDGDVVERLSAVSCPVVIGLGARSEARVLAWARAGLPALPAASLVELEGLGHLGPLEAPARVAASVLDLLGTLVGR